MPYIDRDAIPYFFTEDGSRLVAFKDFVEAGNHRIPC